MEPSNNVLPETLAENTYTKVNTITPLSKYLAMVLFILLPFVGGYIGYSFGKVRSVPLLEISDVQLSESENITGANFLDMVSTTTSTGVEQNSSESALMSPNLTPLFSRENMDQHKTDCEIINEYSSWDTGYNKACYEYQIGDGYKVIAEYAPCGGCSDFYRVEPDNQTVTKLQNVPHFDSILLNKSPITPYYIGMTWREIFKYDFITDTREILFSYSPDDNKALLECGMGCSDPQNVKAFISNGRVYLKMDHFIFEKDAKGNVLGTPKKETVTVLISE